MPLTAQSRKTYLDAILIPPPNRRSWHGGAEFYTPTQAMPLKAQFSQGADAQSKAQTAEQPDDRSEPELEAVEVLEGFGKYALEETSHVLLIGKPGSGKSTALQQLLRQTARQALEGQHRAGTSCIPVLIELRGVSPQLDVWSWIQAAVEAKGVTVEVGVLKSERLLLLFDGLNEATPEVLQAVDQFLERADGARMPIVCTTRQLGAGADLGIQKRLEMLPLSDGQMRQFVGQRFQDSPQQAEVLLRQLGDRLRELAETPLLLQMLCDVCAERGEIPANRGELFRREFRQRYARFKKASTLPNQALLPDLLMHLAGTMMQGEPEQPTSFALQLSRKKARQLIQEFLRAEGETSSLTSAEGYLKDLLANHLLQEVSANPDYIEFHHQLFQEYYAAEWLLQQWPTLNNEQRKCHYINHLKWTEPLMMAAAFVDSEALAMRLVALALEVDWRLGARLAGSVQIKFQPKTVALVAALPVPEWLKIRLLGETHSDQAIGCLDNALRDRSLQEDAVKVLSQIGSDLAVAKLLQVIRDPACVVWNMTKIIGEIGTSASERGLISLVGEWAHYQDDDSTAAARYYARTCRKVVEILGESKSEAALPTFLQALRESQYTNASIVEALGKIGDVSAISDLQKAIYSSNESSRGYAAKALAALNADVAIPDIRTLLNDENVLVRIEAVKVLGHLRARDVIPDLLESLKIRELTPKEQEIGWKRKHIDELRCAAAEALGKIGAVYPSVDSLLIRICEALGAVLEETPEELQEEEQEPFEKSYTERIDALRSAAVKSLGEIGTSHPNSELLLVEIHQGLILAWMKYCVGSGSWSVGEEVVAALARIKSSYSIARAIVCELYNKQSKQPSWLWVKLLGDIGSEVVIPDLIKALTHEDIYTAHEAAKALGKIGSLHSVLALVKALDDKRYVLGKARLHGLSHIDPKYKEMLKDVSHLEDVYIAPEAAEALGGIGSSDAIQGLLKAIESENYEVQNKAVEALGKIGSKEAVPGLIKVLNHESISVRHNAVTLLGRLKAIEATSILLEVAYQCEDDCWNFGPDTRGCSSFLHDVLRALGAIGDASAVNGILGILRSDKSSESIRQSAVEALGEIGSDRAIPGLIQALEDESSWVRVSAARYLGKIGFHIDASYLLPLLEDSETCCVAIETIAQIGTSVDVSFLLPCLLGDEECNQVEFDWGSPSWRTPRKKVTDAMEKIGWEKLAVGQSEVIASLANELLQDERESVRLYVAHALAQLGFKDACLELLKSLHSSDSNNHRNLACGMLGVIREANAAHVMPHLIDLMVTEASNSSPEDIWTVISRIQSNCRFYRYEIDQQAPSIPLPKRKTMSDQVNSFDGAVIGIVNTGNTTIHGNQIGTQNNYTTEQHFEILLADFKSFIDEVQQKHPHVTTEATAIQVIDAEFRELQTTQPDRWQKFLSLKRLWNGGKKAAFKVGEHFAENNVFVKAGVAALEGYSEDPK